MRPEKLKDIEKGKQRKHFKYPSSGRNKGSNCPFRCYGKMMVTESSFQVISLNEEHTCIRNFKYGNLVNYKWIGKQFGHKLRQNLEIKLHEIADLVMKKYKCIVSPSQCINAKKFAFNHGETTTEEHYAMIRSYGKKIWDSNDGSTVKLCVIVNPDDKTYFDRFYCCFYRLKKGFQLGCRHVIALDGCFLKKPNVGEILTAVDTPTGNGLTLILDQHKGLIEAVKDVMPLAEHRQCAMHIYKGFRKKYSGVQFRELFYAASKASYPQMFNKIMEKITKANLGANEYLIKKDPKTWSRALFRICSNCEEIKNGFSECFNSVLLLVRSKPLITMLESIRVIVKERLNTMRQIFEKWNGDICPIIQKRLELNKDKHRFWHVIPAGGNLFGVRNGSEALTVDEHKRTL
ncbi:pentatricopeptide repeat-containing protein [Tanacetum coccineum]